MILTFTFNPPLICFNADSDGYNSLKKLAWKMNGFESWLLAERPTGFFIFILKLGSRFESWLCKNFSLSLQGISE